MDQNSRAAQAYYAFQEAHSIDGKKGVSFKLNGRDGLLFPDAAFLPWHEHMMEGGIEPPTVEWQRKQLIIKYYETRAGIAQGQFEKLKHELQELGYWAKQRAGQPNACQPPSDEQLLELKVRRDIAKKLIDELERAREELGDVRDPRIAAREEYAEEMRQRADEQLDKLGKIQL